MASLVWNNNPFSTTRTHTNTFLSYQQQQQQQQRSKRRAKKILERKCTRSLNREGGCRKVVQSGANATKRGGAETKKAFTNFSYQCINPPDRIILVPLSPPTFSTFPKKEPGEQWIPLSPRNEYTWILNFKSKPPPGKFMAGYKFTQLHGRAGERGNPHLNPLFISPPTPIRSTSPFWPVIRDLSRRKGAGGGGADGRYRKSGLERGGGRDILLEICRSFEIFGFVKLSLHFFVIIL